MQKQQLPATFLACASLHTFPVHHVQNLQQQMAGQNALNIHFIEL